MIFEKAETISLEFNLTQVLCFMFDLDNYEVWKKFKGNYDRSSVWGVLSKLEKSFPSLVFDDLVLLGACGEQLLKFAKVFKSKENCATFDFSAKAFKKAKDNDLNVEWLFYRILRPTEQVLCDELYDEDRFDELEKVFRSL